MRIGWGAAPPGVPLGGLVGQSLGLRPTLFLAGLGLLGTLLWLLTSLLHTLREPSPTIE